MADSRHGASPDDDPDDGTPVFDKPSEKTDRSSEAPLRRILQSITDYAIFSTDAAGLVTFWNVGAERVFGYLSDEIRGQHAGILFTPEDRARGADREEMRQADVTGHAADERHHVRKDGSTFFASGVLTAMRNAQGKVIGYVKVARDLTSQHATDIAFAAAQSEASDRAAQRTSALEASQHTLARELDARIAAEQRVRLLLRRIVTLQEDERKSIARDLHDNIGQQMTALHLQVAALLQQLSAEGSSSVESLRQVGLAVNQLDKELHFFTAELRPGALYDVGLVAALHDFVEAFSRNYGIDVAFQTLKMPPGRLLPEIETNLYRIAQEALNNAYKHARAERVDVLLQQETERVVLTVSDDGVGFDAESVDETHTDRGMGLLSMRERAALVGGRLEIETAHGQGTAVIASVPAMFIDAT